MIHLVAGVVLLVAAGQAGQPAVEDESIRWLKLKRGTEVRLMVEDGGPVREVAGRLLASDPTTVTVETAGGPQRLSRDRLFHLQYRTARRDRAKGAVIGGAITGLAGVVGCALAFRDDVRGCNGCAGGFAALCLLPAAIPGGAIGFAIGTTGGGWQSVKPDGLTVTGAASPRRATVALQLRLGRRGQR